MSVRTRSVIILLAAMAVTTGSAFAEEFRGMSYVDNGTVRVGINLEIGGAITYVSPSDSAENIINSHDWGRQVQMSFYSEPHAVRPERQGAQPGVAFSGLESHPGGRLLWPWVEGHRPRERRENALCEVYSHAVAAEQRAGRMHL